MTNTEALQSDPPAVPPAVAAAGAAASSIGAMGSMAAAAAAAEKVVEATMKVEPMVAGIAGMFVPGMSLVQPWIVMAAPFLERALTDISNQNGGDVLTAFMQLMQHISAGQPNAAVLSPGQVIAGINAKVASTVAGVEANIANQVNPSIPQAS
jgi:hypothetical protein